MSTRSARKPITVAAVLIAAGFVINYGCSRAASGGNQGVAGEAASRVYVAPGKHDELYSFMSGGFSGQVAVYGLPSGRRG